MPEALYLTHHWSWSPLGVVAEYFGQWRRFTEALLGVWQPEMPLSLRKGEVVHLATPQKLTALLRLGSQLQAHPDGSFTGPQMTHRLTRQAARLSGDENPVHVGTPHPLFGHRIAHGMHGVSLGLIALRQVLEREELIPRQVSMRFKQPLILGKHLVRIEMKRSAEPDSSEYMVNIIARTRSGEEKMATLMTVTTSPGYYTDLEWQSKLLSCWQISAALAKTWPLCLYVSQELQFAPLADSVAEMVTRVQGTALDDRGRLLVNTTTMIDGTPTAWGQATVLPYHQG